MTLDPFETFSKGIVELLHAKKILTDQEHDMLVESMKDGNEFADVGLTLRIIASTYYE